MTIFIFLMLSFGFSPTQAVFSQDSHRLCWLSCTLASLPQALVEREQDAVMDKAP